MSGRPTGKKTQLLSERPTEKKTKLLSGRPTGKKTKLLSGRPTGKKTIESEAYRKENATIEWDDVGKIGNKNK